MGDEGLQADAAGGARIREALAGPLERLLAIEPDGRAPRRLAGALAEAVPSADSAIVVVREGERLEIAAAVGVEAARDAAAAPQARPGEGGPGEAAPPAAERGPLANDREGDAGHTTATSPEAAGGRRPAPQPGGGFPGSAQAGDGASGGGTRDLAGDALAAREVRVASSPGWPFPEGTRVGAAAPVIAGGTAGALLLGSRSADAFDPDALLLLRVAADRAALALECVRLERELTSVADAVRRAEADIESRRKTVDYILGIVGHDLRNPLGAVHMSAALLQKKGALAGWQARTVERMRSSAGRMGRIIADLLSYTRTRLGNGLPIVRRPARLDEIVRRVVDELSAANADRAISIATEGDVSGEWDPDRLEQVASNLVSNAVDHGDPGTPVRVELAGQADHVVLRVCNEGPPVPPEVLGHLFEPFARGPDEKSRKASGLGLGLYISREIVRGHGGEISASSDRETTVTVRLPRRGPPATA